MKNLLFAVILSITGVSCTSAGGLATTETVQSDDWFYPDWAVQATNNQPFQVRDTDSALGRYSLRTKTLTLKDLARMHGHLCDGLVIAFVELKAVFAKLFPDGVIDRTDLRAVSKNGPCWVDTVAFMTGARINFQTLRIDNSVGDGFIVQKISTGETYQVSLKPGFFPARQTDLETHIRILRTENKPVTALEIDKFEYLSEQLSQKMLNTSPTELVEVRKLENYHFIANDLFGNRGDTINKTMPR